MNSAMKWDTVVRDGEKRTTTFRSQRLFAINNNWYFNTREGTELGPYMSRSIAEFAIECYIRRQQSHAVKSIISPTQNVYKRFNMVA